MDNRLIRNAMDFDIKTSKIKHDQLHSLLNPEQRIASLLLPGGQTAHTESHIEQIMNETFPDFTTRKSDGAYLKERAILTPRNDDADAINAYMFSKLPGPTITYNSADEVCKASTDVLEQQHLYLVEFLNKLNFPGMPPHALNLKNKLPVMLL
ncbi:ATP-dependent DNA helicase PIF1-like protein [Tanacetum coccineum]